MISLARGALLLALREKRLGHAHLPHPVRMQHILEEHALAPKRASHEQIDDDQAEFHFTPYCCRENIFPPAIGALASQQRSDRDGLRLKKSIHSTTLLLPSCLSLAKIPLEDCLAPEHFARLPALNEHRDFHP